VGRIAAVVRAVAGLVVAAQAQILVGRMRRTVGFQAVLRLGLLRRERTLWSSLRKQAGICSRFLTCHSSRICHSSCWHIRCNGSFSSGSSDMQLMSAASALPAVAGALLEEGRCGRRGHSRYKRDKAALVVGTCNKGPGAGRMVLQQRAAVDNTARGTDRRTSLAPHTAFYGRCAISARHIPEAPAVGLARSVAGPRGIGSAGAVQSLVAGVQSSRYGLLEVLRAKF